MSHPQPALQVATRVAQTVLDVPVIRHVVRPAVVTATVPRHLAVAPHPVARPDVDGVGYWTIWTLIVA